MFLAWDGFYWSFLFWVSFIVMIIYPFQRFSANNSINNATSVFCDTNYWIERDLVISDIATFINPFLWLQIVRDPLIGYSISVPMDQRYWNWHMTVLISIVMLAHTRKRLAYWL